MFQKKKLFFLHIMFLFLSIPILYIYLSPILAQLKMLCFFTHFTHSCEHFAHPTLHVGFKVFCAIFHLRGLHSPQYRVSSHLVSLFLFSSFMRTFCATNFVCLTSISSNIEFNPFKFHFSHSSHPCDHFAHLTLHV